jgi:hypothetical protein
MSKWQTIRDFLYPGEIIYSTYRSTPMKILRVEGDKIYTDVGMVRISEHRHLWTLTPMGVRNSNDPSDKS